LAGNHRILSEILRELSSACVVVSRDLTVVHANRMARRYFARQGRPAANLSSATCRKCLAARFIRCSKPAPA
jgi:hypothetical protein